MPATSIFLSIRILQLFAQLPPFMAITTEEILRHLREDSDEKDSAETWIWEVTSGPTASVRVPLGNLETFVTLCLRELVDAELIVAEDLKGGGKRWRAVPRWPGRDG